MKTVVAIYTGQGLADPLKAIFQKELPDCKLINIIDDGLIGEVVKAGSVPPIVARRLLQYYEHAEQLGADVILNTCSSVGEIADAARPFIAPPIVKIDEAMAIQAVQSYKNIAVLATLPTTLDPTMRLIQHQADRLQKEVKVIAGLAKGAFDALVSGNAAEHDRILMQTAIDAAADADVIVLAQGSMARMEQTIQEAIGKPVLSSPRLGVMQVKSVLEQL
ncbi:aspartate/glutamate racemase family protein [Paenibacillus yanchengensis]|uniref:Aspartate/glutamate racemase family protein n=1 Tax=Paenibacillus yanchengensis TaxID=2035833 RepID=A0ABW4YQ56_9BACL